MTVGKCLGVFSFCEGENFVGKESAENLKKEVDLLYKIILKVFLGPGKMRKRGGSFRWR